MSKKNADVVVTVRGRGVRGKRFAMLVKGEVATALSNIGAFDVTTIGDFAGNGNSCDPERMAELSKAADRQCSIYVEEDDGS